MPGTGKRVAEIGSATRRRALAVARPMDGLRRSRRGRDGGSRRRRRDHRSGAVPPDRHLRQGERPADRVPDAADLAREHLPDRRHEPGRRARGRAVHARHGAPSAGSPIRSIPSRRSPRPAGCCRIICASSAISALRPPPITAARRASRTGSRAGASCSPRRGAYVAAITGESVENWSERAEEPKAGEETARGPDQPCLTVVALLRRPGPQLAATSEGPLAPWGVQLAGNFSKQIALASFGRARAAHAAIIGDGQPMIIGTRMGGRGLRRYYRVRMPAQTRQAANALCDRLRAAGGSCVVLKS